MADTEVVGSVSSEDGINWTLHEGLTATGLKGNTAYKVRPVGPEFEVTTLAALAAPGRVSDPVLSGSAVLGGTLTRQSPGVVTGNPQPEMGPPLWAMRADSNAAAQIIQGSSGETLSVDGVIFSLQNHIRTGTRFFNSQGEITLWSNWVEVTQIPTLQATITPDPLVAGEDFEIVFNPAPDTVSPPTLVRDADDPRRYTGTAPDSGTLAIGATKAGYQPWSQTYTYDPAPVVLPAEIVVESNGTMSIEIPDGVSKPFDVQIAGDVVTLDTAAYTPNGDPVGLDNPDIAGTGGDGEVLTVQSRALFAGHVDAGEIAIVGGWYRNDTDVGDTDTSYTQDDAVDGDQTLTFRETATNTAGSAVAVSNGVLCPAAEIPALPAGLSVVGLFEGEPSGGLTATHTAPVSLGGADPQKTIYVLARALSSVSSGKIIVGGTEYPLTLHHTVTMAGGNNRMALLSAAIPAGGTGTLSITTAGSWSGALIAYVMTTKAMTLVTSGMTGGVTMTAGTAITQTATTLVGDHLLAAIMAVPYSEAGIFDSPVAVTERLDQPLTATGPQLWVGTGVETADASPRSVQVTPSQPGNAIRLLAQFRSAA